MVELVPASWTRQDIRENTRSIMKSVGQVPVSMSKEIPGFVLNRLQYALLNECFRLVLGTYIIRNVVLPNLKAPSKYLL